MKQLVNKQMPEPYIEVLPTTPRLLLRDYPEVAKLVFSADNLPVPSPLNATAIHMVRSKIHTRGGTTRAHAPGNPMEAMQGPCLYI